ncbi:hypothetical protein JTE90_023400 [Oedothorax gibbosus]|uniref:Cytochrome P450 n=1 Tax=Oedothorax gibbosus TaxID=931172 RepID=A0AAV6UF11_9ARAC|nr:hypothetical protein JTE90_023400 [Oedothorax gibbosus]
MFFFGDLNVTQVLGICAFSLFLCYVIYKWIQSKNYPPGPIGLPFLGYWPFLGNFPPHTLLKLSKKYGDIFSFYIGSKRMICVTDYRMAKEILSHQLTLARPPKSFDFLTGKAGFGGLNGDEWQEQRRFALLTMRNLGMGKGLWETMIQVFVALNVIFRYQLNHSLGNKFKHFSFNVFCLPLCGQWANCLLWLLLHVLAQLFQFITPRFAFEVYFLFRQNLKVFIGDYPQSYS